MPSSLFGNAQTPMTNPNILNNIQQIKGMMNLVQGASNPTAMMQSMIAQNPKLKEVMEYVNQNGGDAKAAFYALAKQKGVDPEQVLSILK